MRRRAAILGAGLLLASSLPAGAALSSSPAPLPSGAVARVDDGVVTRASFTRWFDIAGAQADGPRRRARDYAPPRFAGCVSKARKTQRSSRRRATTAQLRKRCRLDYESQRDDVLEFLIDERWVAGDAAERGIVLSAGEREAAFQRAKRASFETESEFRRYLERSAMTYADARFQIAYDTLRTKLREAAIAGVAPVTDLEIAAYYEEHRVRFARPELRDVRMVLARTRAAAMAARRGLERGQTWRHVARKYSIDRASRDSGGRLLGIAPGTSDAAFDAALFRAPKGRLRGPVKGQFGWFVFKVLKINPAAELTLAQASGEIRTELTAERQSQAVDGFEHALRAKWRPRTTCRSGYVVKLCAR